MHPSPTDRDDAARKGEARSFVRQFQPLKVYLITYLIASLASLPTKGVPTHHHASKKEEQVE